MIVSLPKVEHVVTTLPRAAARPTSTVTIGAHRIIPSRSIPLDVRSLRPEATRSIVENVVKMTVRAHPPVA